MNAKILAVDGEDLTVEVFSWSGSSLGKIHVVCDQHGFCELTNSELIKNGAVWDELEEIGEEARREAICAAIREIEVGILDHFRKLTEER